MEKHPELCGGLFQDLDHIFKAYKSFGELGWYYSDESFRKKLSIHSSLKWGMKDVGLGLNLILPQKQVMTKQTIVNPLNPTYKKGCFAFNESQCRWSAACR